MPINPRTKGASGEREAAKWLQSAFKLEACPERNLEQTRSGGFDLIGFPPFAFEIKRCQTISLRSWWLQVTHATNDKYHIPVVMYRPNNKPWKFLISAKYIGLNKGFVHLEAREFTQWVNTVLDHSK